MKTVGIALGAGGARGLAHIVVLQALEDLGITPSIVAGTSIGAVIGAALAAGLSTGEMQQAVQEIRASRPGRIWNVYDSPEFRLVLAFVDPTTRAGGLIKGDKFSEFLKRTIGVNRFEHLRIPLKIVATDYWSKEEVVLERGNLLDAVHASYAMPGLFTPVQVNDSLLVDGGLRNPLPYDLVKPHCDISIAIDVSASRLSANTETPHSYDILFSAFQIMQNSIVHEKLNHSRPDILIRTSIEGVRSLEFNKMDSIYAQAVPAKEELKRQLAQMCELPARGDQ